MELTITKREDYVLKMATAEFKCCNCILWNVDLDNANTIFP